MSDDRHGEGTPQQGGPSGWERLPQGDYDDGATTFVQLPEGGIDALLASDTPLAAPGHGYVPPQIAVTPGTGADADPAGTGSWPMPAEGAPWPDANAGPSPDTINGFTYQPDSTGQWSFDGATREAGAAAPGQDVTGEWSVPVAGGDLPDESGEFSASALVEQWGGNPPATLPGGAAAPWATEPQAAPETRESTEVIGTAWTAPPPAQDGTRGAGAPGASEGPAEAPADVRGGTYAGGAPEAADGPMEGVQEASGDGAADAPAEDAQSDAPQDTPEGSGRAPAADPQTPAVTSAHDEHPLASYVLRVNGAERPVTDAWIGESLLYVLRERLGLAGAKDGCSQGECGACNVQVDGRLVASCLVPAVTSAGSEVRTVEGLAEDGHPSDVQRALARCGAVQCGFCVPGMAMTVHDLLEGNPAPTELETRQALCGNLCRCSGYRGVVEAVREVVAEREAAAEADPDAEEARIPHQAPPGAGGVNPAAYEDPAGYAAQGQHEQSYGQDGGGQA